MLSCFIACLSFLQVQAQSWQSYKYSEPIGFRVLSPEKLAKQQKKIDTSMGQLESVTYHVEGIEDDPNYLYLINLIAYPESTFPVDSIDLQKEFLEGSLLSIAENVGGEILYHHFNTQNEVLYRIKYNEGEAVLKGRILLHDDVFISIQVFTDKEHSLNTEMDDFLEGFSIP